MELPITPLPSETLMQPLVSRECHLAETVVVLDGISGTGKTMMGPILSSLRRVEVQRMDHIHEHLCALFFLGRITQDAVIALLRMYTDLAMYNVMIGRESNFRWKDLSGVLSNPGGWRYVRRLFQRDGEAVVARINRERPILHVHAHQALGIAAPLWMALGHRLVVVEMVRHPLYLLDHWLSYIDRHGTDPRDFTVWFEYRGNSLPWFALGWEERYCTSNPMDRVIYSIHRLTQLTTEAMEGCDESIRRRIMLVPFERFVRDPWPYLQRFETMVGTTTTAATARILRRQKVPRGLTLDGIDLAIYRRYNWSPPPRKSSEGVELQQRWERAVRSASREGVELLEQMCAEYQARHWTPHDITQQEGT